MGYQARRRPSCVCRIPAADVIVPKLVDIADGRAVFDARQVRKRPDWTYEP